jgi:hypothetical protein
MTHATKNNNKKNVKAKLNVLDVYNMETSESKTKVIFLFFPMALQPIHEPCPPLY